MGACSIRACSISKLLTPQQQCILLFFLKLPVNIATSKSPPLREQCWYTLDTGFILKMNYHWAWIQIKRGVFGYSGLSLTKLTNVDGSITICHRGIMCIDFDWGIRCMTYTYCWGGGWLYHYSVWSWAESYWNMHISCVLFVSNGSPMYKSITKAKYTHRLETHETMKRVSSANAILSTIEVLLK